MLSEVTFYPIFKRIGENCISLCKHKQQRERTSQSGSKSSFQVEDSPDIKGTPGLVLSFTNYSDILYESVCDYNELKVKKEDISWPTFYHQLQKEVMNLVIDRISYDGDERDLQYIRLGKHKFELCVIRDETERKKKITEIGLNQLDSWNELWQEKALNESKITRYSHEIDHLKSNQTVLGMDPPKADDKLKKRPVPKSLINPNSKRVKPTGAKLQ